MSLTASLVSVYNIIRERRIKEKCKEQQIGKSQTDRQIGLHRLKIYFIHYICIKSGVLQDFFGEHSLPVLLPFHKQRNAPFPMHVYRNTLRQRGQGYTEPGLREGFSTLRRGEGDDGPLQVPPP